MQLSGISKHRTALMGIAAIMILLCHSARRISMPSAIAYPLSFLNIGVDIFLFLSGMGIYHSLEKLPKDKNRFHKVMRGWYFRRYSRILIPYILIVIPFCGLTMYVEGESWSTIFKYFTTISFWTDHTGFWFIALIIPLYFLAPLIFNFVSSRGGMKLLIILTICTIIALIPNMFDSEGAYVFSNFQFAIIRVPSFILGMVLAPMIFDNKKIRVSILVYLSIIAVILLISTRHIVYTYAYMVLPVTLLLAIFLEFVEKNRIYNGLTFFGKISLESYLFNGAIQTYIVWIMAFLVLPDYNNILMYTLVVLVGTVLAVFSNKTARMINDRISCNKDCHSAS